MMEMWNNESNIADEEVRVVKFELETNEGPGSVTTIINKGVNMTDAKKRLLEEIARVGGNYKTIEIVSYEIVEILPGDDTPLH